MSKPNLFEVVKSVLAAAIGIQSDANRERDFKSGSPGVYLAVGVIATATLVLCIILLVAAIV